VVGFRDFFDAFKGMKPGGETAVGNWRYLEKYGRVSGMGEVTSDLELPAGKAAVSAEDIREIEGFEVELTGPDGQPVALKREPESTDFSDMGMHNLFRIAEADVKVAGLHHLRVKGTDAGQELVIVVGADLSLKDALRGKI